MRCAGTSSVVMASTRVDLPEPMSPVSKPFLPSSCSAHTRSSNVPQLSTSRRVRRKPDSASSSATKSSPRDCGSIMGLSLLGDYCLRYVRPVTGQPQIEFGQPLRIVKGLQDAPYLIAGWPGRTDRGELELVQEAQLRDLVD